MSFFGAVNGNRRESGTIPAVEAQVTEYADRLLAKGKTLSAAGRAFIRSIYTAAYLNSVTVSGWACGSEFNYSRNELINLAPGGASLVPQGSLHADTNLSSAMLGVRVDSSGQGYTTSDGSGLFDGSPNHSVLLINSTTGDALEGFSTQTTPTIFDQHVSAGLPGNIIALVGVNGASVQFVIRPSTSQGVDNPEANIFPNVLWWHINGDSECEMIHAGTEQSSGFAAWADPSANALRLAHSSQPGDVGFAVFLRFDGELSNAQRKNIFETIYSAWRLVGSSILIVGNSVTISGVSHPHRTWPKNVQRWGIHNSALVARRAQGAKRLPYFAPVGYELPPEAYPDAEIAVLSVSDLDWFAANMVCNDEQQNMIGAGQPWSAFLHCHNAIVANFAALNPPGKMRAVICTQMAHSPYTYLPDGSPLDYATIASERAKFLTASQAARTASLSDFAGIPTAIGEVYATVNRGWTADIDGTPADPYDDLPNGDPALFATSGGKPDAQHLDDFGHAAVTVSWLEGINTARAL